MLPYILAVIFPLIMEGAYTRKAYSGLIWKQQGNKLRDKYIVLASLPMFLLIAFRNQNIGADTGMYIQHFNKMVNTPWSRIFVKTSMEEGYIVFVKLITLLTRSPLIYQVVCTSIYFLSVTSFVKQIEENHFLVLFLFGTLGMYTFMFTGVRQCLAISICLFSFRFIKERRLLPFALLMILGFYFHKSSILFVASYFIYPRKLSFSNVFMYAVVMVIAVLYLDVIQQWFNEQLEYDYEIEEGAGGVVFTFLVVLMTVFTIILTISNKKISKNIQGVINIGLIATFFWILRLFTRVAERPSYYFLIFTFASFACAISSIKDSKDRALVKMLVVFLALALFVYRLMTNQASFVPYMVFGF